MSAEGAYASAGKVGIDSVERELLRLWDQAAGPEAELARTVVMTLIAVCPDAPTAQEAARLALAVAGEHPSRTIVINSGCDAPGEISAEVSVSCLMVSHSDRQLCCEQVRIQSSPSDLQRVISAAVPLALSDLPLAVWFPGALPEADGQIERLTRAADRIIVDSREAGRSGFQWISGVSSEQGPAVADIAWVRLSSARLAVARLFDPESRRAHLPDVKRITIEHCGAEPAAMLLAGWAAARLGWSGLGFGARDGSVLSFGAAGGRTAVIEETACSSAEPAISSLTLLCDGGARFQAVYADGSAELKVDTPEERSRSSMRVEKLSAAQALCGALEIIRPDPVYSQAAAHAALLARAAPA